MADDDALIKLAKITRVEAHRRRNKKGQTEQVDSYLRKVLDKFGVGASEKTKRGAFQTGGEAGRQTAGSEPPSFDDLKSRMRKKDDGSEPPSFDDLKSRMRDKPAPVARNKDRVRANLDADVPKGWRDKSKGGDPEDYWPRGETDRERRAKADAKSPSKLDPDAETAPPAAGQPKGTSAFSNDQMFVKSDGDLWESLETGQKVATKDLPGDTEVYYQPGAEGKLGQRSNAAKAEMAQMKNNFSKKRVKASGPLFTESEVRMLRLAGVTKDDIDTVIALGSTASLDRSPKKNWVENSGDLPAYVREVANSLHSKRGMPISKAIPVAISRIKVWARGGDGVDPDTVAKAVKAVAQWEALKAKNKARKATS